MPNQAGDAQGRNNYITANPRGDDFYSMNFRVDHVLTNKQRFFVRYSRNNRVENRGNWTGEHRRRQADRQLPLSASTTRSTSITSGRCRTRRS